MYVHTSLTFRPALWVYVVCCNTELCNEVLGAVVQSVWGTCPTWCDTRDGVLQSRNHFVSYYILIPRPQSSFLLYLFPALPYSKAGWGPQNETPTLATYFVSGKVSAEKNANQITYRWPLKLVYWAVSPDGYKFEVSCLALITVIVMNANNLC